MIDLLPVPDDRFACPCGKADLVNDGFYLPGMIPLVRAHCPQCRRRFLAHLHTGFYNHTDFVLDEASGEVQSTGIDLGWYRDWVAYALASAGESPHPVQRVVRRAHGEDVLLLNCLDPIYGHCLHRLFSLDAYRQRNFAGSVVAIVPRFLAWLAPDDIDELWVVDAPLRECNRANATVAEMTAHLAAGVRRLRYAGMAYGGHTVDIARYAGVAPFAVTGHDLVSPPRLTLNWREDRCWTIHGRPAEPAAAIAQQHRLFCLLLEKLREQAPNLDAVVTGYGQSGQFPAWVQDLRLLQHDTEMERRWARRYAQSHLSFGVHGSNMILPSALSMGAMELVLVKFWPHVLFAWEWANRMPASDAVIRYRLIPVASSVSDIVSIALMQLRRMQSGAGYELMYKLREQESAASINSRHEGVFRFPEPMVCRDERGDPF